MNIKDINIPVEEYFFWASKMWLDCEIIRVNENPFSLNKSLVSHYRAEIKVYEQDEDGEIEKVDENLFFYADIVKENASEDDISQYIYTELRRLIQLIGYVPEETIDRNEYALDFVYKYACSVWGTYWYENTEDFIRDYEFWVNRIYHTMKFFMLLYKGTTFNYCRTWKFPLRHNLLNFLEIDESFFI
jgi:hypothetical protein